MTNPPLFCEHSHGWSRTIRAVFQFHHLPNPTPTNVPSGTQRKPIDMRYPYEDGPRMPGDDNSNITPAMTAEIMRSIAKTLLDKAEQLDPVANQEPPETQRPQVGLGANNKMIPTVSERHH